MKKNNVLFWLFTLGFFTYLLYGQTVKQLTPEEIQENIVENCSSDRAVIWLDIRDDNEVNQGIIASDNCRPYHVSWNFDWDEKSGDIPKDLPIIIYCRSGHRAGLAAEALVDSGYNPDLIAIMTGGINAYTGTITSDSSMIKDWSELPEPSFPLKECSTKKRNYTAKLPTIRSVSSLKPQRFNLRGQVMKGSIYDPDAPVFILERIGETNRKHVVGIQRLIQDER